uniref:Selenoprotein O n=1 Tax=Chromera velia CCMP2878 TaxID=1169474 RepID=A0A0G4I7I9_9ALVE|eukprot:Cvel_1948.t1-p1 / transcript=Cvel_1948.t1 / gene=Cvel_1948 / organism=Chromera_velia_CCMP2878 / gene_product=Selenoprotein O, putative / transcript_product=Selenoprotein O, putative / location=Cvel_scaffold73:139264-147046(+) / protein_length=658 / sequence_SO=supercontig / SO=protein_coding / is_pseudo=false
MMASPSSQPSGKVLRRLEETAFHNITLRSLPVDSETKNFVRQVHGAVFSLVDPTPVERPRLVSASRSVLEDLLGISFEETKRPDFAEFFCGNKVLQGARPAAHCYCGHQFGNFAGQLGDGATMYLGEVRNPSGERWEIQYKGAGKTPFSRSADGRKVLRSSLREFLCSEHMNALGVPTTRAGTLVTSDSKVVRDIFYSGDPIMERCTVITRIAKTFIRFGSFEIFKPEDPVTGRGGPSVGRIDILTALTNFVLRMFYPHLLASGGSSESRERDVPVWEPGGKSEQMQRQKEKGEHMGEEVYARLLGEVAERTGKLVALWQCVGWCHGVLNTDNMSIVGDTIDYGPYGFMETTSKQYVCNGSDDSGRYSYGKQAEMCRWNVKKLGEALMPLLSSVDAVTSALSRFDESFEKTYNETMALKLGFSVPPSGTKGGACVSEGVKELVKEWVEAMERTGADFTATFRAACLFETAAERAKSPSGSSVASLSADELADRILETCASPVQMAENNKPPFDLPKLAMLQRLAVVHPEVIAQFGLDASKLGEMEQQVQEWMELKGRDPDGKRSEDEKIWRDVIKKYEQTIVSEGAPEFAQRSTEIKRRNPKMVLRNHILQEAIEKAEAGDFGAVGALLEVCTNPFEDSIEEKYCTPKSPDADPLIVT